MRQGPNGENSLPPPWGPCGPPQGCRGWLRVGSSGRGAVPRAVLPSQVDRSRDGSGTARTGCELAGFPALVRVAWAGLGARALVSACSGV